MTIGIVTSFCSCMIGDLSFNSAVCIDEHKVFFHGSGIMGGYGNENIMGSVNGGFEQLKEFGNVEPSDIKDIEVTQNGALILTRMIYMLMIVIACFLLLLLDDDRLLYIDYNLYSKDFGSIFTGTYQNLHTRPNFVKQVFSCPQPITVIRSYQSHEVSAKASFACLCEDLIFVFDPSSTSTTFEAYEHDGKLIKDISFAKENKLLALTKDTSELMVSMRTSHEYIDTTPHTVVSISGIAYLTAENRIICFDPDLVVDQQIDLFYTNPNPIAFFKHIFYKDGTNNKHRVVAVTSSSGNAFAFGSYNYEELGYEKDGDCTLDSFNCRINGVDANARVLSVVITPTSIHFITDDGYLNEYGKVNNVGYPLKRTLHLEDADYLTAKIKVGFQRQYIYQPGIRFLITDKGIYTAGNFHQHNLQVSFLAPKHDPEEFDVLNEFGKIDKLSVSEEATLAVLENKDAYVWGRYALGVFFSHPERLDLCTRYGSSLNETLSKVSFAKVADDFTIILMTSDGNYCVDDEVINIYTESGVSKSEKIQAIDIGFKRLFVTTSRTLIVKHLETGVVTTMGRLGSLSISKTHVLGITKGDVYCMGGKHPSECCSTSSTVTLDGVDICDTGTFEYCQFTKVDMNIRARYVHAGTHRTMMISSPDSNLYGCGRNLFGSINPVEEDSAVYSNERNISEFIGENEFLSIWTADKTTYLETKDYRLYEIAAYPGRYVQNTPSNDGYMLKGRGNVLTPRLLDDNGQVKQIVGTSNVAFISYKDIDTNVCLSNELCELDSIVIDEQIIGMEVYI